MKSRRNYFARFFALVFATAAIIGVIQGLKIKSVHGIAKRSTSEYFADQHRNFFFIARSFLSSDLVVRGTVIDPDSLVGASEQPSEIARLQEWQVTRIRGDERFSGHNQFTEIYIPSGWWPSHTVGNSFLQPFAKDEEYLFFLKEAKVSSLRTDTKVFTFAGQGPIPLSEP